MYNALAVRGLEEHLFSALKYYHNYLARDWFLSNVGQFVRCLSFLAVHMISPK